MPLQQTSGNATADAFGNGAAVTANYIEDVFSTWLYTGTGATQTITNEIDLAGKGGLVWSKERANGAGTGHWLSNTVAGITNGLRSNQTSTNTVDATEYSGVTSTGYTLGTSTNGFTNFLSATYVSWTFRKQPKFFDVVTWTGTGASVAHSLGVTPGMAFIKSTTTLDDWAVVTVAANGVLYLNLTNASSVTYQPGIGASAASAWLGATASTCDFSNFTLGTDSYVAYLFAHNAGGFGLTGTDNVISCGIFTTDGSGNASVTLGYEPQWVMVKSSSAIDGWIMLDVNRGWSMATNDQYLSANTASAESVLTGGNPTATGFVTPTLSGSTTYIYMAIRRGPMRVPIDGTKVLGLSARTGTGANATVAGGQNADAVLIKNRASPTADLFASRLTKTGYLVTSAISAEVAAGTTILQANPWDVMDGVRVGTTSTITNASANTFINYLFRRAPSFFDEVCYTGNGATQNITHNLTVAPELIICKSRSNGTNWPVGAFSLGQKSAFVNTTAQFGVDTVQWNNTAPTATVFSVGASDANVVAYTYVAYLFATCPGVSKVGTYTGTGATQTIACGFAAGARFVLVKRADSTGEWYVWDSARGMVAGTDPSFVLNTTAAEVNANSVYAITTGFQIVSTAADINASGGSYIFLAIA